MKTNAHRSLNSEWGYALVFISPWIIGFLIFNAYPIVSSLIYSFSEYNIVDKPKWVGLANFAELFTDEYFYKCLYNNFYYVAIGLPLYNIMAIMLANYLSYSLSLKGLYRLVYFLPIMMPAVASSILWKYMYNPDFGIINTVLSLVGIRGPIWLADRLWVKPALIGMSVWYMGRNMLIYLAAMQAVPRNNYEAAIIDGASSKQIFFRITLPMITPVIFFNLIVGLIGSFQYFTEPLLMTGGGPNGASITLAMYIYRNGFEYLRMGYGASIAWMLFILILIFTMLLFSSQKKWVRY